MREKMLLVVHWEEDRNVPIIVVVGKYLFMPKKY